MRLITTRDPAGYVLRCRIYISLMYRVCRYLSHPDRVRRETDRQTYRAAQRLTYTRTTAGALCDVCEAVRRVPTGTREDYSRITHTGDIAGMYYVAPDDPKTGLCVDLFGRVARQNDLDARKAIEDCAGIFDPVLHSGD